MKESQPQQNEIPVTLSIDAARIVQLSKRIEASLSPAAWEKLGNDLLAAIDHTHASLARLNDRALPEEASKRNEWLGRSFEMLILFLNYREKTRQREDGKIFEPLVEHLTEKMEGPQVKEYDSSFRDLCTRGGISPFIQGLIPDEKRHDILVYFNDSEDKTAIRQVIAHAAVDTVAKEYTPGIDRDYFISRFILLARLLNGYPANFDGSIYKLSSFEDDGDIKEIRKTISSKIIGTFPPIYM